MEVEGDEDGGYWAVAASAEEGCGSGVVCCISPSCLGSGEVPAVWIAAMMISRSKLETHVSCR